jgi:hypothetical protein
MARNAAQRKKLTQNFAFVTERYLVTQTIVIFDNEIAVDILDETFEQIHTHRVGFSKVKTVWKTHAVICNAEHYLIIRGLA